MTHGHPPAYLVWSEQHDAVRHGAVRLHSLEQALAVVQHTGGRGHLQWPIRAETPGHPLGEWCLRTLPGRHSQLRARTSLPRSQVATYMAAVGWSPKPSVSQLTKGLLAGRGRVNQYASSLVPLERPPAPTHPAGAMPEAAEAAGRVDCAVIRATARGACVSAASHSRRSPGAMERSGTSPLRRSALPSLCTLSSASPQRRRPRSGSSTLPCPEVILYPASYPTPVLLPPVVAFKA